MLKYKKGQTGFTLIEILIVCAILGILLAVAIPNIISFINTGKVAGANSEVATIQTANQAFLADNGVFAADSTLLTNYLNAPLKAEYTFDWVTGWITAANANIENGWGGSIIFSLDKQCWLRADGE